MDPAEELLSIELTDSIIEGEKAKFIHPGQWTYEVALPYATKKGTSSGHPSEVPIRKIGFEVRKQLSSIEQTQEMLAARTAIGLGIGRYDWLDGETTYESLGVIGVGKYRLRRLAIEPWRRWAQGFSCFFFVWVAIPFSIWMKSADHWTSFGACFMPILLLYYPMFAIGLSNAKDGVWPAASVWLGNLALLIVGAWWLRVLQRS